MPAVPGFTRFPALLLKSCRGLIAAVGMAANVRSNARHLHPVDLIVSGDHTIEAMFPVHRYQEMIIMATTPTQIRIDTTVKEQANNLFASLGMDMSSAVNIFLRQCILHGGLPFAVEIPQYNQTTLDAMAEARRISRDPDVKGYTSMADLKAALESDD